jgi:hypothetical protein
MWKNTITRRTTRAWTAFYNPIECQAERHWFAKARLLSFCYLEIQHSAFKIKNSKFVRPNHDDLLKTLDLEP